MKTKTVIVVLVCLVGVGWSMYSIGKSSSPTAAPPTSIVDAHRINNSLVPGQLEQAAAADRSVLAPAPVGHDVGQGEYEGAPPPEAHLPSPPEECASLPDGVSIVLTNENTWALNQGSVGVTLLVKNFIGQPTKPGARVKLVLDKGLWIDGRAADIFGANLVEGFGLGVNTESKRICENLLGNRLTIRGMLPNGGVGTSEVAIDLRFLAGKDAQPSDSKQLCVHLMVRGPGDKKWHETQSMGWDYWADPNQ